MTSRRFCFVTTFYPPDNFGGDGIAVQRLAQALARRRHDVTVVHDGDAFTAVAGKAGRATSGSDEFGVKTLTLRSRLPLLSTLLNQQVGRPVLHSRQLRHILDGGRFDVIAFNNVSLIGGAGILSYGSGALKLYLAHEHWLVCPTHVLWRHGREACDARECIRCQLTYRRPPQLWRHTGLLNSHLDHIDMFIAMSEFSRNKHLEFGFRRDMEVLPNFVPDDTALTPSPRPHDRPYFLCVGRLERIKGFDEAIAAVQRLEGADLVIAGEGGHGTELRRAAAGNPRVRFVGVLGGEELTSCYRHALAVIVPSVCFETFGMPIIEAFSARVPVIARRIGPFPELLAQSGGGELFDTTDELIASLERMQRDPAARERMAASARASFVRHWSEQPVVDRFLELVERAAAARHHRSSGQPAYAAGGLGGCV